MGVTVVRNLSQPVGTEGNTFWRSLTQLNSSVQPSVVSFARTSLMFHLHCVSHSTALPRYLALGSKSNFHQPLADCTACVKLWVAAETVSVSVYHFFLTNHVSLRPSLHIADPLQFPPGICGRHDNARNARYARNPGTVSSSYVQETLFLERLRATQDARSTLERVSY